MQKKFNLIIFLLIVSIVLFTAYNVYDLNNKSDENEFNRLISNLNIDTTDFTLWISNKKKIVDAARDMVDNFTYDEIVQWNTANPYLNINNDDPDISQIYIGLATGEFITGGQWVPPEDYDPRTRVWYQEAVEAGGTIISDVYIDRETGDRTVTISSPLYLEDQFVGVISADVFMNDINEWLSNKISGKDIYTYLLDEEGTIIVHTLRPELVGANLHRDTLVFDTVLDQPDIFLEYFEQARNSNQVVRMEYVAEGHKTRGIVRRVEEGDWYIAVAAMEEPDVRRLIRLNGRSISFNLTLLSIVLVLLLLTIRVKKELEEKNQLLTIDNELDFLTGVFNRRYFNLYMEELWKSRDGRSDMSLVMMDIDYFKGYNDTYGHITGDDVLKKVTDTISNTIRKQDVLARYGGEEFVLILEQVTVEDVEKVAKKIVEAVYESNIKNESSPHGRITISIGAALLGKKDDVSVQQFAKMADDALYRAKDGGRNRYEVSWTSPPEP